MRRLLLSITVCVEVDLVRIAYARTPSSTDVGFHALQVEQLRLLEAHPRFGDYLGLLSTFAGFEVDSLRCDRCPNETNAIHTPRSPLAGNSGRSVEYGRALGVALTSGVR